MKTLKLAATSAQAPPIRRISGKRKLVEPPLVIADTNLSHAWGKTLIEVSKPGTKAVYSLVVSIEITASMPIEDLDLRTVLDHYLLRYKALTTGKVASTIFPKSLWNPQNGRHTFYDRYLRLLPTLKKATKANQYGLYFERLIAFGHGSRKVNQLEQILTTYEKKNRRPTAFQASVFDPYVDHTHQLRRGFPCLQQVAFALQPGGDLAVTGFYASQYIFERAYGNYLGLYNLGLFMAEELGLHLRYVNCVANVARLGDVSRKELADLIQYTKASLPPPANVVSL